MSCSTTKKSSPRNTFAPSSARLMNIIKIKIKIAAYDTSSADEIFGQRTLQSVPRRRETARLPPNNDRGAAPLRTEVLALSSQEGKRDHPSESVSPELHTRTQSEAQKRRHTKPAPCPQRNNVASTHPSASQSTHKAYRQAHMTYRFKASCAPRHNKS